MKILMVYCNSMLENALPMGVSQLIACLQETGHNVALFDTTFYRWDEKSSMEIRMENLQFPPCEIRYSSGDVFQDLRQKIMDFSPDMIGLSIVEPTFYFALRLLRSVRDLIDKNKIIVAVGGVHAIYAPTTFLAEDSIDYICIGEGERGFIDLCNNLERGIRNDDQPGFYVRTKNGDFRQNELLRPVDLNSLPILDFTLFGSDFLLKPMMGRLYRTVSIELSRGCPYTCTYCGNAWLADMFRGLGGWYRQKSIEKIHQEYQSYIKKYDPEFIYKHSESFLATSRKRFSAYMEMYSQYSIPYWIETRPEDISDEKAERLAETGCRRISIGLESGNEVFRKKVLRRNHSNELVKRSCSILRDKGISFSMNLILGFPNETREMIFDGIRLLREVKPDSTSIFLYTPYKGSALRKTCEDRGMVEPDFIGGDYFQMRYSLRNNSLSAEECLGLFRTVPLYVKLPETEYDRIERAEKYDDEGNREYLKLKDEYFEVMGWQK